jgi:N-acetylglucosamine kinase-like BadF-type ATPase
MTLVLGVDGGNSKTVAAVADAKGRICGMGRSGGSNHQTAGLSAAVQNLRAAVEQALAEAGAGWGDLAHAVYALAGADRDADVARLQPALAKLPAPRWTLVCDTVAGLRLGAYDGVGVVVVCGAGTNAFGRNLAGCEVQTGGMGWLFGDGASGDELARRTFRAAIRSWELRDPPSLLTAWVPQRLGFRDVREMVNDYLDHARFHVPLDLAKVAHEAADAGDALAQSLLAEMGREIGLAVHSVLARLRDWDGIGAVPVVLVGSILQRGRHPLVLDGIRGVLDARGWSYHLVIPELPPVWGAVCLALDEAGARLAPEEEAVATAQASARMAGWV